MQGMPIILFVAAVALYTVNVYPQENAGDAQGRVANDSATAKKGPVLLIEDITEDEPLVGQVQKNPMPATPPKSITAAKDTAPLMPAAKAKPAKDTLTAPLTAISVPGALAAPQPFGCPTCTQPGLASSEFATNFLIGKNYLLPATKMFALASSNLWLVQKETRFGNWALAGGPSLETYGTIQYNFLYDFMDEWERRVADSLGITRTGYYQVYGGGG